MNQYLREAEITDSLAMHFLKPYIVTCVEMKEKSISEWRDIDTFVIVQFTWSISLSQPHAAHIVFTNGYKSKFFYFMRTIDSFQNYIDPIQETIDDLHLPTLFGQTELLPSDLHQLVTLSPAKGGLSIPYLWFEAP